MTNAKARRQAKLATEQAAIERRLANAVAINLNGPVLGRARWPVAAGWPPCMPRSGTK
jgi:hypothetical protein